MAATCPICERRRARRLCPGLPTSRWAGRGETICAPCCGAEREVRIDCPPTCSYLLAARRYEAEQAEARSRAARPGAELAFPEVRLDEEFVAEQRPFLGELVLAIARAAEEQPKLADPEVLLVLERLAKTYQTLSSGLYYEQAPEGAWARELYAALQAAIERHQQERQKRTGVSLRPVDILKVVVFLVRLGHTRANGRPHSRAFLDFLRAQLPAEALTQRAPRIILPGS